MYWIITKRRGAHSIDWLTIHGEWVSISDALVQPHLIQRFNEHSAARHVEQCNPDLIQAQCIS